MRKTLLFQTSFKRSTQIKTGRPRLHDHLPGLRAGGGLGVRRRGRQVLLHHRGAAGHLRGRRVRAAAGGDRAHGQGALRLPRRRRQGHHRGARALKRLPEEKRVKKIEKEKIQCKRQIHKNCSMFRAVKIKGREADAYCNTIGGAHAAIKFFTSWYCT